MAKGDVLIFDETDDPRITFVNRELKKLLKKEQQKLENKLKYLEGIIDIKFDENGNQYFEALTNKKYPKNYK